MQDVHVHSQNRESTVVASESPKCLLTGMCQSPFPAFFQPFAVIKCQELHLHTKTLVTNKMTGFFGTGFHF